MSVVMPEHGTKLTSQQPENSKKPLKVTVKTVEKNWWYHNDYIDGLDEELIMVNAEAPPNIEEFNEIRDHSDFNQHKPQWITLDEMATTAVPALAGTMALRSFATTMAISFPLLGGAVAVGALAAHVLYEDKKANTLSEAIRESEEQSNTSDVFDDLMEEDVAYMLHEGNNIIQ